MAKKKAKAKTSTKKAPAVPAKRGRGRPPLSASGDSVDLSVFLSPEAAARLQAIQEALGGSKGDAVRWALLSCPLPNPRKDPAE